MSQAFLSFLPLPAVSSLSVEHSGGSIMVSGRISATDVGDLVPKKVYSYLTHHLKRVWSQLQTVKTLFLPYVPFVLTDVGVPISHFFYIS